MKPKNETDVTDSPEDIARGSLQQHGSASLRERTVDECLAWAETGDLNAGERTIQSIKVLAMEVRRLRRIEANYEELATAIETKWRLNQRTPNGAGELPGAKT